MTVQSDGTGKPLLEGGFLMSAGRQAVSVSSAPPISQRDDRLTGARVKPAAPISHALPRLGAPRAAHRGWHGWRQRSHSGADCADMHRSSRHRGPRSRIALPSTEIPQRAHCRHCAELSLRFFLLVSVAVRHIGQHRLAIEQAHCQNATLFPCSRPARFALEAMTGGVARGRLPGWLVSRCEHDFPLFLLLLGFVGRFRTAFSCLPPTSAANLSKDGGTARRNRQQNFAPRTACHRRLFRFCGAW
jgi:hypothetical protein